MSMLGWMWGVIKLDRITSGRRRTKVGKNVHESTGKKVEVIRTCREKG